MPDPRRSWAGVLGASGRGSVVPSMNALYLADPQEVGPRGGCRWFSCLLSRAGLGRLEAEEALERLGRKCCN